MCTYGSTKRCYWISHPCWFSLKILVLTLLFPFQPFAIPLCPILFAICTHFLIQVEVWCRRTTLEPSGTFKTNQVLLEVWAFMCTRSSSRYSVMETEITDTYKGWAVNWLSSVWVQLRIINMSELRLMYLTIKDTVHQSPVLAYLLPCHIYFPELNPSRWYPYKRKPIRWLLF